MSYDKIEDKKIFLIIFYPDDNTKITKIYFDKKFIKGQIEERIKNYKICFKGQYTGEKWANLEKFEKSYENILKIIKIQPITWEDIITLINTDNSSILEFYQYCKNFNKN